jgi:uncharacterized protein
VGALGWIIRFLIILFIVRLVLRLLFGARRGNSAPAGAPRTPGGRRQTPERAGGQLVKDPQCGTYVAEGSAVRLTRGRETLFFCSNTCRDAYDAAHPAV